MAADEQPPSTPQLPPTARDQDDAWRPDWDPQRLSATEAAALAPVPGGSGRRSSRTGVLSGVVALALVAVAIVLLNGNGPGSTTPATTVPTTTGATTGSGRPDAQLIVATRRLFDQVNAEAGAAPARQRAVLEQVAAPSQRANQRGCAAASTTVRLIPAWSDVRVAPDGHLIVPSLIRIFTGTRITGTDVAIIDVTVTAGQPGFPALCVS